MWLHEKSLTGIIWIAVRDEHLSKLYYINFCKIINLKNFSLGFAVVKPRIGPSTTGNPKAKIFKLKEMRKKRRHHLSPFTHSPVYHRR